jgi:hypothetical protein
MNCPILISCTTIRSNMGTWSKSGMNKPCETPWKWCLLQGFGWLKNYGFKSSNLLKIKDSIFASNIKPHCHCKFRELQIGYDSTYQTCVFMEEEWKEMVKSHVCMDGNGFWQAQKRYNLHKAYIGHMVLKFHNFALPFKCKYTAKCKEINPLITSMMSSGGFIESFVRIYPRPKSPYMNWIWKRAFGNHICPKVKTPNMNLSLLSNIYWFALSETL